MLEHPDDKYPHLTHIDANEDGSLFVLVGKESDTLDPHRKKGAVRLKYYWDSGRTERMHLAMAPETAMELGKVLVRDALRIIEERKGGG